MKKIIAYIGSLLAVAALQVSSAAESTVKAWEENVEIPTYVLDAPEAAPIFDCDWSYQRARRSVYPYPLNDNMTRTRKNVTYKALFLENEYVKVCVLPEIGGRLFYAIDKTNGYDIFYHQDVIKPANVGMNGAWISGGVEWNVFHHHRVTSHSPVDYKITENKDGSKTIWVGETEWRHRMSWAIGVTLFPGKSYMQIDGRLANTTKNSNSILFWANASTHCNDDYQIIFPQNTEFGTFHCKSSFCRWPITREPYNGTEEYKNNIDASWWKNHPVANSIFAFDRKEDFIGGYDHGKDAGTMMVANRHISSGGKFWLWGPNSGWPTKILTDSAGHYVELMMGAYSDNQPDYNWIYPYEVKTFTQYYYGIRGMKGAKQASKIAAMNVETDGSKLFVSVNSTQKLENLTVTVCDGNKELFSRKIDVSPDSPYAESVEAKGVKEENIRMTLSDSSGKTLLSYAAVAKDPNKPLPEIVKPPLPPREIKNTEECYLVGLRNLQFHNPFVNPVDYFEEVLRRDPGDTRANTQMGIILRQRGDLDGAEKHLRTAIKRLVKDYTRPMDCEAIYNLGLVLRAQGKMEDAEEMFYRALWNYPFNSAANTQLAQMYSMKGDFDSALERVEEALAYNGRNIEAANLKTSVLRAKGDKKGALECAEKVLAFDPVNAYAAREKQLLSGGKEFEKLMRDDPESYLELAIKYMHNGFDADAVELLEYANGKTAYATVKMWLGFFADKAGDKQKAEKYFKEALECPFANVFRLETARVLEKMSQYLPDNWKIHYYLGNLNYDKIPEKAVAEWEKSLKLNPNFAMAWRNMGWAYWKHFRDYKKAAQYYHKAIDLEKQPIFLEEGDQVFEAAGEDIAKRYELLKSNHAVAEKRYYPLAMEVVTGTYMGDFDYVLGLLRDCYFPTREGVGNFHDVYVDALLTAGWAKADAGDFPAAEKIMLEAFKYPENHQVFLYDTRTPRDAQIYCMLAQVCERAGEKAKAEEYYRKAAEVNVKKTNYRYWKGLALAKIGREKESNGLFESLVDSGKKGIVSSHVNFYGAEGTTGESIALINSRAYYTMGLGELGLGKKAEAKAHFEESDRLNSNRLWTREMLRRVEKQ